MYFLSEQKLDESITEREFILGDISGILWTPSANSSSAPVSLILMGQPGGIGMRRMYPVFRHGRAARPRKASLRSLSNYPVPATDARYRVRSGLGLISDMRSPLANSLARMSLTG